MKNKLTGGLKLLLTAGLLAVFLSQAGLSFAHAHYKSSNIPAEATISSVPAQLTITFGEETSPTQTKVQVTDAGGKQVDKGDLKVDGASVSLSLGTLADGKYTVTYRTLTEDDGGIVNGSFGFVVAKSGTASAGTGKAQEAESVTTPSAAPATGLGGTQSTGNTTPELIFGLLAITLFAGVGLVAFRSAGRR